ncbi:MULTISPECIES: HsdM family class I SAM-dependent methyltransferase [Clostridium]|uniref:HsdM family class I SAM-dependent methyltransferase n=1 Tax=Clostridium TaxID=1485 RepID=UPI00242A3D5B|nr:N-6 DNA methylase [Clostridium tyrobutyricum]
MAKKEIKTDLWVYDLLKQAEINLDSQGSNIKEINDALKTASKKGTGNVGFPEYVGVVKDYLLVIEDKADLSKHIKFDNKGLISTETTAIKDYAVNGALFYGKHLFDNTTYKKVIAFGVSGDEKKHKITPIYIDETEFYRQLPEVESFISFNEHNIDEYYTREILKEDTDQEKETAEILKDAATLHEDLRNYGNLKDTDKPLVVSGILLALRESEFKNFSIDDLTGDDIKTDGQKIYDAISDNLKRSKVAPEVKKDKLLSQFALIKDTVKLNEIEPKLGKTPLKYFTEFLYKKIYKSIRYSNSAEDYIGRFYGEFMSYSGGDGQTLGIILTPKHITELCCDLVNIQPNDIVLDPCCGTAGFLIAAMHNMIKKTNDANVIKSIKQKQLHGIEIQPYMFTIATTNMILRGDGKSNLINEDFLKLDANKLQLKQATVGMMNPPYSQGSKQNPNLYEIAFTEHLLDSLTEGARCAVIVPQSSMTGKTKEEQSIKENILKHHTLEGVITLNKDTFYGVGTIPCIAVFTAGEPHPKNKVCKFINFEDDGYKVAPHIGLIETEAVKDKKQHLLDVWFDRIKAESKFCVKTTIEATDEWLHSFYYFNDDIPIDKDFEKTVGDYLSFEFSMIMQNRQYLFNTSLKKKEKNENETK